MAKLDYRKKTDAEASQAISAELPEGQKFFTAEELSKIFGLRRALFDEWRCLKNGGPSFTRLGRRRIVYPRSAVIKWASEDYTKIAS